MKDAKKTKEKYVTMLVFEKAMASVARSFSKVDERFDKMDERFDKHDGAFTLILKQMHTFTEEAREHRQTMSSLMHTDIKQERIIEDLKIRVERLEMRVK